MLIFLTPHLTPLTDLMTPLNELRRQLREEARPVQLPIAATPALPRVNPLPDPNLHFNLYPLPYPDPNFSFPYPALHSYPDSSLGGAFLEDDMMYDELEYSDYDVDDINEANEENEVSDPGDDPGSPPEEPKQGLGLGVGLGLGSRRVEGERDEEDSLNGVEYVFRQPTSADPLLNSALSSNALPPPSSGTSRDQSCIGGLVSSSNGGERSASQGSCPIQGNPYSVSHCPSSSNGVPNLGEPNIVEVNSRGLKRDREEEPLTPNRSHFVDSSTQNGNCTERDTKRKRYDNSDGQDATR